KALAPSSRRGCATPRQRLAWGRFVCDRDRLPPPRAGPAPAAARGGRAPCGRWADRREPRRVLIAHHLLLGDTLMLTALVAKLRSNHPEADLAMTVPRAIAPLY